MAPRKEQKMKKAISLLICLTLVLSLSGITSASALSDVPKALEVPVDVLQMLDVISGFPDGTFRPGEKLTRAQFCKMAVILLGKEAEIPLYKNFTIFMDVKASHWAVGEVNLAARSLKLLAGFPDGTFRPENPVTYAQAVTILMRALGYTDADVGLSWPSGYMNKAKAIGLTANLPEMDADSAITRGNGAVLFYNTLLASKKDGGSFINDIGQVEKDAIILDNNATAADGTGGAVLVAGRANPIKSRKPMPDSFRGMRGTLVLDGSGWIKTFLPGDGIRKSIVLKESSYPYLTSSAGERYRLDANTPFYIGNERKSYLEISYDLTPGTVVDIYYTSSGSVDYVIAETTSSSSSTAVVLTDVPSYNGLLNMFGASSGALIYKNGTLSTAGDLSKYDVVVYNKGANIFTVNDFKLSGIYENAYPNTSVPSRVTILGTEFEVDEVAIESLSKFRLGDAVTLMFGPDMKVVGAIAQSELRHPAVGVYTGSGILLTNGTTLNIVPDSNSQSQLKAGTLVRVYKAVSSYTSVVAITDTNPGVSVDLNKGTVGDRELSGNAVFYEKVGQKGKISRIDPNDIVKAVIAADKVRFVGYDSAGRANVVVLDDVTGDLYEYGKIYAEDRETPAPPFGTIVNRYAYVVNSQGESERYLCNQSITENSWAGIAHDTEGRAVKVVDLKEFKGLTRQSFVDGDKLLINGILTPTSKDVHIYVSATGRYMTASSFEQLIIDARAFGEVFEAYTDKAPSEGGKVRVIVVK